MVGLVDEQQRHLAGTGVAVDLELGITAEEEPLRRRRDQGRPVLERVRVPERAVGAIRASSGASITWSMSPWVIRLA